jgi:hypothetical protein
MRGEEDHFDRDRIPQKYSFEMISSAGATMQVVLLVCEGLSRSSILSEY